MHDFIILFSFLVLFGVLVMCITLFDKGTVSLIIIVLLIFSSISLINYTKYLNCNNEVKINKIHNDDYYTLDDDRINILVYDNNKGIWITKSFNKDDVEIVKSSENKAIIKHSFLFNSVKLYLNKIN